MSKNITKRLERPKSAISKSKHSNKKPNHSNNCKHSSDPKKLLKRIRSDVSQIKKLIDSGQNQQFIKNSKSKQEEVIKRFYSGEADTSEILQFERSELIKIITEFVHKERMKAVAKCALSNIGDKYDFKKKLESDERFK